MDQFGIVNIPPDDSCRNVFRHAEKKDKLLHATKLDVSKDRDRVAE